MLPREGCTKNGFFPGKKKDTKDTYLKIFVLGFVIGLPIIY